MLDAIIMNMIKKRHCNTTGKKQIDFYKYLEQIYIYMYRGSIQDLYWNKAINNCLDVPCVHFKDEIFQMY